MNKTAFMEENFHIIFIGTFILMISFVLCLFLISSKLRKIILSRYNELAESYQNSNVFFMPYKCYLDQRVSQLNDPDINQSLGFLKLLIVSWWIICFVIFFFIDRQTGLHVTIPAVILIGALIFQSFKKKQLLELVLDKFPDLYEDTLKGLTATRNEPFPLPEGLENTGDAKIDGLLKTIKVLNYLPFIVVFVFSIMMVTR